MFDAELPCFTIRFAAVPPTTESWHPDLNHTISWQKIIWLIFKIIVVDIEFFIIKLPLFLLDLIMCLTNSWHRHLPQQNFILDQNNFGIFNNYFSENHSSKTWLQLHLFIFFLELGVRDVLAYTWTLINWFFICQSFFQIKFYFLQMIKYAQKTGCEIRSNEITPMCQP